MQRNVMAKYAIFNPILKFYSLDRLMLTLRRCVVWSNLIPQKTL